MATYIHSRLHVTGEDEANTDKLVEYVQLNNAALRGKRALQEWRETVRARDMAAASSADATGRQCLMGAVACLSLTAAAVLVGRSRNLR
jgi:hypothetical protein|eukprot:COSAG02_NODE_446_length_22141_cov_17.963842_11_plen_89_part_00